MITRNILMKAIEDNDIEAITAAKSQLTPELLNSAPLDGNTPLQEATRCGHHEIIDLLLAAGADINAKGSKDFTSLMEATERNQCETAYFLLSRGADASIKTSYGYTLEFFVSTPDQNFHMLISSAVFYNEACRAVPAQLETLKAKHKPVSLDSTRVKNEYVTPDNAWSYFMDVIVKNKDHETKKTLLKNASTKKNAFTVFLRQSTTVVAALEMELKQIDASNAGPGAPVISSAAGMAATGTATSPAPSAHDASTCRLM